MEPLSRPLAIFRRFLADIGAQSSPNELSDAAVLLSYGSTASRLGITSLSSSEIHAGAEKLESLIDEGLGKDLSALNRCELLEARAILSQVPLPQDTPESHLDRILERWEAVINAVKEYPLFPVDHIGQILEVITPLAGTTARFKELAAAVDSLIAERSGNRASGDRARNRAVILLKHGHKLAAIDELQRVKASWLSGESLEGSIIAMLLLSQTYLALNLPLAARYYAAGALYLALRESDDRFKRRVPQAAFAVAESFYTAGEGITFLHALSGALFAHAALTPDADDWSKHKEVQRQVAHALILRAVVLKLAPHALPLVDEAIDLWPLGENERDDLRKMSAGPPWSDETEDDLRKKLSAELGLSPLGDLGPQTEIKWSAFGLLWTVRHEPNEEARLLAMEVATTLQVVQADLGDMDLVIPPSNVTIQFRCDDVSEPSVTQQPRNEELIWAVVMPKSIGHDVDQLNVAVTAVAIMILRDSSALPYAEFDRLIEGRMERGLFGKVLSVRPVRELLKFADPNSLDRARMAGEPPLKLVGARPIEAAELSWKRGPGPSYSREKAIEALQSRYTYGLQSVRMTLPRMLRDARWRRLIKSMRAEGLLDWQILAVLSNLVAQWQDEKLHGRPRTHAELIGQKKRLFERVFRAEDENDPDFDLEVGLEDGLKTQRKVQVLASFHIWGLEVHRVTPDFEAAERLLAERFGHSADDIAHDDPFPNL